MTANVIYAAVDLGGTNVATAFCTEDGAIVGRRKRPTDAYRGPESVLGSIVSEIRALSEETGTAPAAIGLGVPGLVDIRTGTTRFLPNLPTQWRDVPAGSWLRAETGLPVYVLNDARCAALGELVFGHGRQVRSMAFFTLGTGIGGGVVLDGRLRLGELGAAGELGHQTLIPDGPLCGCGNHGCLEALASGPAITGEGVRLLLNGSAPNLYEITGGDPARVTPAEMARAAKAGDPAVREALVRACRFIGIGVANVVTILHPELVVLGGGVAEIGDLLFDTVRSELQQRVRMFPAAGVRVERSLAGDDAGLLGAAALAMQKGIELEGDLCAVHV